MALKTVVPTTLPITLSVVCEVVNQSFNGTMGEHLFGNGGLFAKASGTFHPNYVGSKDRLSNFLGYQQITDFYTIYIVYGDYLGGWNSPEAQFFKLVYTKSSPSMPNLNPYGITIISSIKYNEIGNQVGTTNTCAILNTQIINTFVFGLLQANLREYLMSLMPYNEYFDMVTGCYAGQSTYGLIDKNYNVFSLNKTNINGYGIKINGFTGTEPGGSIDI